jgi:hypothetical protein
MTVLQAIAIGRRRRRRDETTRQATTTITDESDDTTILLQVLPRLWNSGVERLWIVLKRVQ